MFGLKKIKEAAELAESSRQKTQDMVELSEQMLDEASKIPGNVRVITERRNGERRKRTVTSTTAD